MKRAVLFGNGYWASIVKRYLDPNGITLIGIIDADTKTEEIDRLIELSDLAFVCTPVPTHYDIVKRCLLSGTNVFCEKVLTTSSDKTIELFELAEEKHLVLFVDYLYLYSRSLSALKTLLQGKKVLGLKGKITQFGKFYPNSSAIETIGVHLLSAFHYLFEFFDAFSFRKVYGGPLDSLFLETKRNIFLECSLLSNVRSRQIEVLCEDCVLSFSLTDEDTLVDRNLNTGVIRTYSYDEKNNLDKSIKAFLTRDRSTMVINKSISIAISLDLERIVN